MQENLESRSSCRKVYIAGPMRGRKDYGFDRFDHAKKLWEARGYHVISPADFYRMTIGPPPKTFRNYTKEETKRIIFRDMEGLAECDCVAVLGGWERSRGATLEVTLALFLGMPIYSALTFALIPVSELPYKNLIHSSLTKGAAYAPDLSQCVASVQGTDSSNRLEPHYDPDHAVT